MHSLSGSQIGCEAVRRGRNGDVQVRENLAQAGLLLMRASQPPLTRSAERRESLCRADLVLAGDKRIPCHGGRAHFFLAGHVDVRTPGKRAAMPPSVQSGAASPSMPHFSAMAVITVLMVSGSMPASPGCPRIFARRIPVARVPALPRWVNTAALAHGRLLLGAGPVQLMKVGVATLLRRLAKGDWSKAPPGRSQLGAFRFWSCLVKASDHNCFLSWFLNCIKRT